MAALVAYVGYCLLFGALQASIPGLAGVDAYHHVTVGALLGQEEIAPRFRWLAETTWAHRHADKDLLLHGILAGSVRLAGDRVRGGKLVAVLLAAGILVLLRQMLIARGVVSADWWCLALVAASPGFVMRLGMVRSHLLGVLWLLACLAAYWGGRRRWLLALAIVYPLAYTAWHSVLALVGLLTVVRLLGGRPWDGHTCWIAPLGLAIGLALHPHAPHHLGMWFDQNVVALTSAPPGMQLPEELGPMSLAGLVSEPLLPAVWGLALAAGLPVWTPIEDDTVDALALAAAFGLMALAAARFLEYAAPMAMLLGALLWRDLGRDLGARWTASQARGAAWAALGVLLVLGLSTAARGLRSIADEAGPYAPIAARIAADGVPGERVFHTSWGMYPPLMFHDSERVYLVGMDPHFFHRQDPDRWRQWRAISDGEAAHPVDAIRVVFRARWVVSDSPALDRQLERDPRVVREVEGALDGAPLRLYRIR